ncbi:MAG: hypothetical protein HY236_14595 [Acidobacteria bacterium]|nr:hypothetical protein [Acidobacteriota bacterium]
MRVISILVLAGFSIGWAPQLAGQSPFPWRGRVAPGLAVEIKGINSNVSAEAASGNEVEVTAEKRGRRLRGTIGSGGRELVLKTVKGSIRLRRAA